MMIESNNVAKPIAEAAHGSANCVRLSELVAYTARKFRRNFSSQLMPLGITFAQAQVLRIVARADVPLRMVDIAAKLDIVPRSATTKIDALQANGLVERLSDHADRRSIQIAITDKGRILLAQLDEARKSTAEELFRGLSQSECQELSRLLSIVCSNSDSPDSGRDGTGVAVSGTGILSRGEGGIR
ncbi:MAG: MarR family transcriptional regulator [Actinomycetota bacterium]|nr:MAG: MarR family transcriptional regulator [Actinomycetota bacterium]